MFDYLIAGLGNPGKKYENTRHNIGWMVALSLIEKYKAKLTTSTIFYYADVKVSGTNFLVCLPTTFMNASGEAIMKISRKHSIMPDKIIAVVDEYNFPVGRIHLRKGGSDGGHNGISSLIEELGTEDFYRLRCGIAKDFGPGELVDYVLSPFPDSDLDNLKLMIEKSVFTIEHIAKAGINRAMNDINSDRFWA